MLKDLYEVIKASGIILNDYNAVLAVGTAHQTISDEAVKNANRVDLTFQEKTELSKYLGELLGEENRLDTLDLIMAMPGSTLDDFYEEFNLIWYTKVNTPRYQYLFLPDSPSTEPEYLKKYNIELVEVKGKFYSTIDLPKNSIYAKNDVIYHTIASSYSFTKDETKEMWVMNQFGYSFLFDFYADYESKISPKDFTKLCWDMLKQMPEFPEIWDYATRLFTNDGKPLDPQYLNKTFYQSYIDVFIVQKKRRIKRQLEEIINEQLETA